MNTGTLNDDDIDKEIEAMESQPPKKSDVPKESDADIIAAMEEQFTPEDNFYNPDNIEPRKGITGTIRNTAKKKSVIFTACFLLIVFMVVSFGGIYVADTGQFVSIGHMLEQANLGPLNFASNYRAFKLLFDQAKLSTSGPTNNVGRLTNFFANQAEGKLNEFGLKPVYEGSAFYKYKARYIIEPYRKNSPLNGLDEQGIRDYFKTNFGIDLSSQYIGGIHTLTIEQDQLGFFKTRRLVSAILDAGGINKVAAAIDVHAVAARDGFSLNPFKLLTHYTKEAISKWWSERTKNIEDGTQSDLAAVAEHTDSNGQPAPQGSNEGAVAQADANTAQSLIAEEQAVGQQAAKAGKSLRSLDPAELLKKGLGGLGIISLVCIAAGLNNMINTIKEAKIVLPLVRLGMQMVSIKDSIKSNTNVHNTELAKYSSLLYNPKNHTSFANARSVEAMLGQPQTGPPPSSTLTSITHGNVFTFVSSIPGIGTLCTSVVQTGLMIIGIYEDGIQSVIMLAAGPLIGHWLSQLAMYMAGVPVDPNSSGANFGYNISYGTALAANDQAASLGGTALSQKASNQLSAFVQNQAIQDFNHKSIWYRTFSLTDPRSLLGHFMLMVAPSFKYNLVSFMSAIINSGKMVASLPMKFVMGKASAAIDQPYDYGFPAYGFSKSELDNPAVSNPYTNANYVSNNLFNNPTLLSAINTKTTNCFGVSIANGPNGWDTTTSFAPIDLYNNKYQGYDCTGAPNGLTTTQWLQARMFIFDNQTARSLHCYYGSYSACVKMGFLNAVQ